MITRFATRLLALFAFLSCLQTILAADGVTQNGIKYVTYTNADGEQVYLEDNRKPALYTQNFGDCLGGSSINISRFDAAYYQDNMTVLFHLAGNSGIANDSLMMYIGVFAYGEDRFDLIFNPCSANIYSLCPINSSIPITASGIIPVAQSDVANIPAIALSIPDFEGEAILRIFSNRTREEIACYSAVVTNGNSFGQPTTVGSVLGFFTFVALVASFATAICGVVFAVWQHIFFSGALSVNWPSVLVAWWSNFAWAGGMIYSSSMQSSINKFIGNNVGNTSQVGAAQAGSANSGVGGGYDLSLIYRRAFSTGMRQAANHPLLRDVAYELYGETSGLLTRRELAQRTAESALISRDTGENGLVDASEGFKWYGHPVGEGFPLPGNYSGFAGTLAEEGIRVGNAFMTGFLWFLIALVLLVSCVVVFKWFLEGLARIKWIKNHRLRFFRDHWLGYTAVSALRICFVAWFMIMFLTVFQFTFQSSGGVVALAAIVFTIFFIGMPAIAAYAWWYKHAVTDTSNHLGEHNRLLGGKLPMPRFGRKATVQPTVSETRVKDDDASKKAVTLPLWKRIMTSGHKSGPEGALRSVHDDEDYTMKFGWLAARFRRTRWWFFTAWLFYEFLRAIFYGGASGYAKAQVFGLLVIEFFAFCFILWARPFEGQRLNIIVVYCLGFSKVATVALSAAFDVEFNLQRIITTVIGIVIIVIQGFLTIITLVAIVTGAISSYMSVSRNNADFRPRRWHGMREKYFDHLDRTVNDVPREPKPKKEKKRKPEPVVVEEPKVGFEMKNIRRLNKIEDDGIPFASDSRRNTIGSQLDGSTYARSQTGTPHNRSRANSRAQSVYSTHSLNLPYGARPHRQSWSIKDFNMNDTDVPDVPVVPQRFSTPIDTSKNVSEDEPVLPPQSAGKQSRRSSRNVILPASNEMSDDEPVPPPPSAGKRSRRSSRNIDQLTMQNYPSTDTLNVGGEVSTLDTIGKVPMPTIRPRTGNRSNRNSLTGSLRGARSSDFLPGDLYDYPQPPSQRASVNYGQASSSGFGRGEVLTPTQELDELVLSKVDSLPKQPGKDHD